MTHGEVLASVQQSDACLNTSISEGMCNFILEAFALETPVIARKNEGNSFLLRESCGHLFETKDELKQCLFKTYNNKNNEYVQNAFQKIQQSFSMNSELNCYRSL